MIFFPPLTKSEHIQGYSHNTSFTHLHSDKLFLAREKGGKFCKSLARVCHPSHMTLCRTHVQRTTKRRHPSTSGQTLGKHLIFQPGGLKNSQAIKCGFRTGQWLFHQILLTFWFEARTLQFLANNAEIHTRCCPLTLDSPTLKTNARYMNKSLPSGSLLRPGGNKISHIRERQALMRELSCVWGRQNQSTKDFFNFPAQTRSVALRARGSH